MAPAVKDVNGPKKPLSAYIAWQGSAREGVVKTMPEGYSFGDLAKKFSATWKEMSEAAKSPFETKAKADLEKYHKAMEKYKLTDNYKKFQELKAQSKVDAVKKSKFRKDENAPKRAPNGYFLFMQSKKDELTAEGLAFTEVSKKCGSLWNGFSDAEKKPFEDKAAAAKKKYDADLAKYQSTGKYKKYMAEKAAFEANKKDELKKAKGEPAKAKGSKSRSRSSSKAKKVKKSKSRSRSRSRSKSKKSKKSKSRSRSRAKKAKRSKSRSRSKKRSKSRSRSRSKKSKKSKSRSRSRKPKGAKRKSKSRSRKRSRSARRASKPKAPKSSAKKAAKPKAAKSKSRSRSRKRSRSRSAKKAKRSRSRSAKKAKKVPAKKDAAPKDAPKDVPPK